MHVSLIITHLGGGGAAKVVANLAEGLSAYGIQVDIVQLRQGREKFEVNESVRIIDIGASKVYYSIPTLIKYLNCECPDAVLSSVNTVNIVTLVATKLSSVSPRIVISEHNTLSVSTEASQDIRTRLLPHLMRFTYPWADSIVTVSNGVASDLRSFYPKIEELISVIHNPVVTPRLIEKSEGVVNHDWFSDSQYCVILGVGELVEQKDFPTLIRSFALVKKSVQNAKLVILGEGQSREELTKLSKDIGVHDSIWMPGFVSNPYKYMSSADVFALSSRWEGLPTVLIEALACGCPVVSTNCPSGPNEILDGGKYGELVPVGDVEKLAEAIISVLNNSGPTSAGRADAFSYEKSTREYIMELFPHRDGPEKVD